MLIRVPSETAERGPRVALVPEVVRKLVDQGLEVVVQRGAGAGALIPDAQFEAAGARLVDDPGEVFAADMVVKVSPPNAQETAQLRPETVLIGFLAPLTN